MTANMSVGDWRLGMTLAERLGAIGDIACDTRSASHRRWKRWRKEHRNDIASVRRLTSSITVEPSWWREFWDIYSAVGAANAAENGFLVALGPIITRAIAAVDLQLSCSGSTRLMIGGESRERLLSSLAQSLRERLLLAVAKTLVLELAVASRAGVLKGATPEARFSFFCECLKDQDFAASLLAQYPVLVRRCIGIATDWDRATGAMLARISASDTKLIAYFFDNGDPGRLVSVEALGDAHRRGQAVHVLSFENGPKLIYKPRPVAMERCYYDLIAWLRDRGLCPEPKVIRTLEEDAFGWMEFVPFAPCNTVAEVSRFFARIGAHLALTLVLSGTDLHSENVIANGEHPVPVDLETLFHFTPLPDDLSGATARGAAELRRSVVRAQVLPGISSFGDDPKDFADLSALGHSGEQLTPSPVAGWASVETDRMRLIYKRAEIPAGPSLPQLAGQQVQSGAYVDAVVHGFTQTYDFLRKFRAELLAPQGPLSAFLGKPTRRVCRDTATYGLTLFASYHPRFQRDAIACEAMLHDAMRASSGGEWRSLKVLEDKEVGDLLACDIPYFFSSVGSGDVPGADERTEIRLVGNLNPYERIDAMSERDCERQVWLIRVAMQDLAEDVAPAGVDAPQSTGASSQTLIATAARIGDRICDVAIEDGDRCTWLVPEAINMRRLVPTVAGFDLYEGLSGIALFLTHLGAVTREDRYCRMASAAIREALSLCRAQKADSVKLGAFQGIGSLCYTLVHLSAITNSHDLANEASMLINKFAKRAARTTDLDLMSGSAGFIVAGLIVARFNADAELIERLLPVVERLYRLTTSGRRSRSFSDSNAGLAHGRAGVALAFLRWAEATGDIRFRTAAQPLIQKDLEIINSSPRNAIDHPNPLGWCRGSPGIAMAALSADDSVTDLFDTAWKTRVIREIALAPPSRALCLCHGTLGQLEFFRCVSSELQCDDQTSEIESWQRALLSRIVAGYWVANTAHTLELPGLMLGLAGTGYSLLREALGKGIPSVLALEAPAVHVS
jgi:type 2 lantibiotic biosynthesis protein LanM